MTGDVGFRIMDSIIPFIFAAAGIFLIVARLFNSQNRFVKAYVPLARGLFFGMGTGLVIVSLPGRLGFYACFLIVIVIFIVLFRAERELRRGRRELDELMRRWDRLLGDIDSE